MILTKVFIFQDCMLQSTILPKEGKVITGKVYYIKLTHVKSMTSK